MSTATEPPPSIKELLAGCAAVGSAVTVKGWVKTRRDSKAGLSFVHVHDGSCFDPIQVVVEATLPNYNDEILHLTTGCAVIGLLLADRLPEKQRKAVGWTLFLVGAAVTIPLAIEVLGHSLPSRMSEWEWQNMELLPL